MDTQMCPFTAIYDHTCTRGREDRPDKWRQLGNECLSCETSCFQSSPPVIGFTKEEGLTRSENGRHARPQGNEAGETCCHAGIVGGPAGQSVPLGVLSGHACTPESFGD